jgi:ADP-heptose:LPS heptosyltransferase
VSPAKPVALVLRALGLGDLLAAVPALRGVRRALPEHHLALATDPALAGLVRLVGGIDELVPARGLEPLDVPHPVIDVAVDLHGKGPLSQPLLQRLRPRRLVAFGCPEVGVDGPVWRRDEHEVRRWCRLVSETFGLPTDPSDLTLPVPAVPPAVAGAVVVHPGAAFGARRWPAERFAAVAAELTRRGARVVVTGSAAERKLAQEVARIAGLDPASVLAGSTDVQELAALVAAARLVVSGDTGTAHLASAFAVPSVVLFGPTPPAWWGPPATGPHVVLWHGEKPGDPWGSRPDPALLSIEVEEVLAAVDYLHRPKERTSV